MLRIYEKEMMAMGYRKSIVREVFDVLHSMAAYGCSKHEDKKQNGNKPRMDRIYSYSTMKNYLDCAQRFARWARAEHGCRTLADARRFVPVYLSQRMRSDKSPSTLHTDCAALAKLYQCTMKSFGVSLPKRKRADVKQHRQNKEKGHFSEKKHADLKALGRSVGARVSEARRMSPDDVWQTANGLTKVRIKGKGGKIRVVTALDDTPLRLAQKAASEGRNRLIEDIPKYTPFHVWRAEFAQALYEKYARDPALLSDSERYVCRAERKGTVYDRRAMRIVSKMLGHNRLSVVTSYIK